MLCRGRACRVLHPAGPAGRKEMERGRSWQTGQGRDPGRGPGSGAQGVQELHGAATGGTTDGLFGREPPQHPRGPHPPRTPPDKTASLRSRQRTRCRTPSARTAPVCSALAPIIRQTSKRSRRQGDGSAIRIPSQRPERSMPEIRNSSGKPGRIV